MLIYPAMDLMDGGAVRLRQGRFDDATRYAADPFDTLRGFADAGAQWAHIVDLDGARDSAPRQHDLLARLCAEAPLKLQVAGGFRDEQRIAAMLDAGAGRVVIGSLAVQQPEQVAAFLKRFGPERITIALDVRLVDGEPCVATKGWTELTAQTLWDVAKPLIAAGLTHILVTDIGLDGMMQGPNVALMRQIGERLPGLAVQASGGVSSLDDLDALRRAGAAGAIVGKALWEGRIALPDAIRSGAAIDAGA